MSATRPPTWAIDLLAPPLGALRYRIVSLEDLGPRARTGRVLAVRHEHAGRVPGDPQPLRDPSLRHTLSPEWLTDPLRTAPPLNGAVYVEVGTFEWVLLEPTRRLRDLLTNRGAQLTYREFTGGHDRTCWRGSLLDGLRAVTARWHHEDGSTPAS